MKKDYITILYTISSFAVIMLHTNGIMAGKFNTYKQYVFAHFIECLFYYAVPVFYMLCGATLLNYKERYSTKTYFIKRLTKVFLPFIFWSFIALLFNIYVYHFCNIENLNIKYIITGIFHYKFMFVYWFFIPLFQLYIIIPILALINKTSRIKLFLSMFILIFLLNFYAIYILQYGWDSTIRFFNLGFMYLLLGYILSNTELKKKTKSILYILGVLGFLMHFIGILILSDNMLAFHLFKDYDKLPCILYSVTIFVPIKDVASKIYSNKKLKLMIEYFKEYTYATYIIHMYVINCLVLFLGLNTNTMSFRYGMPIIIILLCVIITKIMRKTPFGIVLLPK